MKYATLTILALVFIFSSCGKGKLNITDCEFYNVPEHPGAQRESSFCNTDTCTQYLAIWQELIQEKNNLSQAFFDNHIEVYRTSLNYWNQGVSFRACYSIQVDWAIAAKCNSFIINIKEDNTNYPTLDLPRGVNLTKEEIEMAVERSAFSSFISKISTVNELEHLSLEIALEDLTDFADVNTLCINRIDLDDRESGNLVLKAKAQYSNRENSCIFGTIDLFTGEKDVYDSLCYIIG